MVAATIWRQQDTIEAQQHSQNSRNTREANMLNGRKKMIKMLIVVVAVYTVCWLPFNIYYVSCGDQIMNSFSIVQTFLFFEGNWTQG